MLFQEGIVAFFGVYSGFICKLRLAEYNLASLTHALDGLLYGFFGASPW